MLLLFIFTSQRLQKVHTTTINKAERVFNYYGWWYQKFSFPEPCLNGVTPSVGRECEAFCRKKRKRKGGRVRTCPLGDIPKDLEVPHYFLFLYPDYHAHATQPAHFGFLSTDVI